MLALLTGLQAGSGPVLVVIAAALADVITIGGLAAIHRRRGGPVGLRRMFPAMVAAACWMLAAAWTARTVVLLLAIQASLLALVAGAALFAVLAPIIIGVLPEERRLIRAAAYRLLTRQSPSGG